MGCPTSWSTLASSLPNLPSHSQTRTTPGVGGFSQAASDVPEIDITDTDPPFKGPNSGCRIISLLLSSLHCHPHHDNEASPWFWSRLHEILGSSHGAAALRPCQPVAGTSCLVQPRAKLRALFPAPNKYFKYLLVCLIISSKLYKNHW